MIPQLVELGFKLLLLDDDVFFNQYGTYPHIYRLPLENIDLDIEYGPIEVDDPKVSFSDISGNIIINCKPSDKALSTINDIKELNEHVTASMFRKDHLLLELCMYENLSQKSNEFLKPWANDN